MNYELIINYYAYDEEDITTFSTSNFENPFPTYYYLDLQENILLTKNHQFHRKEQLLLYFLHIVFHQHRSNKTEYYDYGWHWIFYIYSQS